MGFGGSYFTEGFGLLVRHWFMFTVTVVLGFAVGAACIAAGMLVDGSLSLHDVGQFDFGLLTSLGVGFGVFGVGLVVARIFLAPESTTVWTWAILIAVEIAMSMVVVTNTFRGHRLAMSVAWTCGVLLTVLTGRGLWWFNRWMDRRWVAQLRKLHEENSLHRLERQEPRWARPPKVKGLTLDQPLSALLDIQAEKLTEKGTAEPTALKDTEEASGDEPRSAQNPQREEGR
ncbi:MAG: hypothetical protein JWO82_2483 [Akkermansiaceae bacterium]|nr:hypothetical protein [Akkermansiaceae bacterium]